MPKVSPNRSVACAMAEAKCVDANPASSAGGYSPMTQRLYHPELLDQRRLAPGGFGYPFPLAGGGVVTRWAAIGALRILSRSISGIGRSSTPSTAFASAL